MDQHHVLDLAIGAGAITLPWWAPIVTELNLLLQLATFAAGFVLVLMRIYYAGKRGSK